MIESPTAEARQFEIMWQSAMFQPLYPEYCYAPSSVEGVAPGLPLQAPTEPPPVLPPATVPPPPPAPQLPPHLPSKVEGPPAPLQAPALPGEVEGSPPPQQPLQLPDEVTPIVAATSLRPVPP